MSTAWRLLTVCGALAWILSACLQLRFMVGAFLADEPRTKDIVKFKSDFGKKPDIVMIFIDWGSRIPSSVIRDVEAAGSILLVTWEPWNAKDKTAIDFNGLLGGREDVYLTSFADQIKGMKKPVWIRFGHEMNGDWYPWSSSKIGSKTYIAAYRYVKDFLDRQGVRNAKWIFSVNAEDVPPDNRFEDSYPGDRYVDLIGIDGYNWGTTKSWSRWMSFREIFYGRYQEIVDQFKKPVVITEFASSSQGGDKAHWIKEAFETMRSMKRLKGCVLFNVDKETDWSLKIEGPAGFELHKQIAS